MKVTMQAKLENKNNNIHVYNFRQFTAVVLQSIKK